MAKSESVVEAVNGHAIRVVYSERFGKLYMIDDIGSSAPTLEGAGEIAPVALTDAMMRNA